MRDPRVLLFPVRRAPHREGGDGTGTQGTTKGPMSGMTVLVVEDDFIVAYDMQMMLEEQGARVLGPATSLAEAKELLAKERPTVAVLDVNLNGEYVFPLADQLRAKDGAVSVRDRLRRRRPAVSAKPPAACRAWPSRCCRMC